jgi:hypothetical protein
VKARATASEEQGVRVHSLVHAGYDVTKRSMRLVDVG